MSETNYMKSLEGYLLKDEEARNKANENTEKIAKLSDRKMTNVLEVEIIGSKYYKPDGSISDLDKWSCCITFIPVIYVKSISITVKPGAACVIYYDESKNIIGVEKTESTQYVLTELNAPIGTKYFRYCYSYSDTEPVTFFNRDEVLENELYNEKNKDDLAIHSWKAYYYINTTGDIKSIGGTALSTFEYCTEFIDLSLIKEWNIPLLTGASSIACYDANKNFIAGITNTSGSNFHPVDNPNNKVTTFDSIPEKTKYVRFSRNTGMRSSFKVVFYDVKSALTNQGEKIDDLKTALTNQDKKIDAVDCGSLLRFDNLTMCALGDSLTAGGTIVPWTTYMSDLLKGLTSCENKGVSGSNVCGESDENSFVNRYTSITGKNIIAVWGGINDKARDKELGTIESDSNDTFYGALKTVVSGLYSNNPGAFIFLITPPKAVKDDDYDFRTPNTLGKTDLDFVNAIKEVGDMYSIPVLDMYTLGGMSPLLDDKTYRYDGLHYSENGYKRVACIIARFIITHFN